MLFNGETERISDNHFHKTIKVDFNEDTYNEMTEPSGYTLNESDRMVPSFSDVTVLERGSVNFIAKGIRYGKWFIIKGINPPHQSDERRLAMLRKEFDLLLEMDHPGIVRVANFENVEGLGPCIVMQFVDGETLRQWLRNPRSLDDRFNVAVQLLDTIKYIHSKGVVHRDIKPENIMISRLGSRMILIDFGLADTDEYAILKNPAGTSTYISPEQKKSSIPDIRNDIYSVGKVLKELLPERQFGGVFKDWEDRDRRPDSVEALERKLKRADRFGRRGPWFIMGGVLIIACAIVLPLSLQHRSSDQQAEPTSSPATQPAIAGNIPDSGIINEELPSPDTEITMPVPVDAENNIKEVTVPSPGGKPSTTQTKDISTTAGQKGREESFKEILKHGSTMLEQVWEDTAIAFLDTVSHPALIPKNWDMKRLNAIKNNYIQILKMSIVEKTSNMEQYSLTLSDIEEMNKIYDNQIKGYQNKWNNLRNKKISGH